MIMKMTDDIFEHGDILRSKKTGRYALVMKTERKKLPGRPEAQIVFIRFCDKKGFALYSVADQTWRADILYLEFGKVGKVDRKTAEGNKK